MKRIHSLILLTGYIFLASCGEDENPSPVIEKSSEKQLLSFVFSKSNNSDLAEEVSGVVDETDHSIKINFANGTNVTALSPSIGISDLATVNPASDAAVDFSNPVTYTVTAEDGTTQAYTATATVAKKSDKDLISFKFLADKNIALSVDLTATVDETDKKLDLVVPFGTDLSGLIPSIVVSGGATIDPANEKALDFTEAVTYTVTAEDGTTQAYTIAIEVEKSSETEILSFQFLSDKNTGVFDTDVTGVIDDEAKKIELTVRTDINPSALVPSIVISEGATISPANLETIDFRPEVVEYTVTAQDGSSQIYKVQLIPDVVIVSGFSPQSGWPTQPITISGEKFSPIIENNYVTINGKKATITAATETSLTVTIPQEATTGKIKVSTRGLNEATTTEDFAITSIWQRIADFAGSARHSAISFSAGGKGYIGCGSTGGNDLWEYDPITNVWTQKANLRSESRQQAAAFSIGGKGYIGTGGQGRYTFNDFWEYNPSTNQWARKANFGGISRSGAVAMAIGDKGYIGLGHGDGERLKDFWEYDPATDQWTQKKSFDGEGRIRAVAFSIGTKGYVGTGQKTSGVDYKDFWEYDPATDQWTQKADLGGLQRNQAVGFAVDGKGYIGTGYYKTDRLKDLWAYDPAIEEWKRAEDLPTQAGRYGARSFVIDNKAYVGNGFDDYDEDNTGFWEFDPNK